eukprot:SAG31_NODE_40056_length_283_cov_1.130435_1_plen_29_part_10
MQSALNLRRDGCSPDTLATLYNKAVLLAD